MTDVAALRRDYRTAFLRYLPRREESALAAGYELGRRALTSGLSMLDLALIHHEVLAEVLSDTPVDKSHDLALAAAEFFLEAFSTFDMTQRSILQTDS